MLYVTSLKIAAGRFSQWLDIWSYKFIFNIFDWKSHLAETDNSSFFQQLILRDGIFETVASLIPEFIIT